MEVISQLAALLSSTVVLAIPILIPTLGEVYTERTGVMNLGLEGIMSTAAFVGLWATITFGQFGGLLLGMVVGALLSLIVAFLAVSIGTHQVVTGLMVVLLGQGIGQFGYRYVFAGSSPTINVLPKLKIPVLSKIPILGEGIFHHNIVVYIGFMAAIFLGILLYRTETGLNLRMVGESPAAADTAGINVKLVRYLAVIFSGAMAGLGGAFMTIGWMGLYQYGIISGRGWLAYINTIVSGWDPYKAVGGSILFGGSFAIASRIMVSGAVIPHEIALMLPYILGIIAIALFYKGRMEPDALLQHYERE